MRAILANEHVERRIQEALIVPDVAGDDDIPIPSLETRNNERNIGSAAVSIAALQLLNMTAGIKKERQRYF